MILKGPFERYGVQPDCHNFGSIRIFEDSFEDELGSSKKDDDVQRFNDDPEKLIPAADIPEVPEGEYVYAREFHPNSERVEAVFDKIFDAHTLVYCSGLAAFNGLITHVNPKQISFGQCYHGVHCIADILTRNHGLKQLTLSEEDLDKLQEGDLLHIETPLNPYGISSDLKYYADKAHAKGAFLSVDATFAPPPLQDPFKFGADFVMHSATKYFGGHSDLLAGVLAVKSEKTRRALFDDRMSLGANIANMESYLLLRSLRTYDLRIAKQSANVGKIVSYLSENRDKYKALTNITHSSLQTEAFVKEQLPNGYGPVFCINLDTEQHAKTFPSKLKFFQHATSLGGVESLVEWRALSDSHIERTLLRFSVGTEDPQDLIEDLDQALSFFN